MQRDFKGIWIPKEICCQNDLNITEEIVLSVVSTLSEQDDGCFANNEYFESVSQPIGSMWNKFFKIKFKIP